MKNVCATALVAVGSLIITGCATDGLSEAAQNSATTKIWFDNASVLVDANDPDLKADTLTGVASIDLIVDSVKDILVQIPSWSVSRVEQKHFNGAYMECAKAVNAGSDGAELVVKGEAFKTMLLMDTIAQEIAHTDAALKGSLNQRKDIYAKNAEVYDAAVAKVVDYANNQIYALDSCADDAARVAFYADPSRSQWDARTAEITKKIMACVANAQDEAAAKDAMEKLCREMGVQSYDWIRIAKLLPNYLEKLQKAIQELTTAMQEPTLAFAISKVAFGGEIVPGTAGKETLAVIKRFGKQLKVNVQLVGWMMKAIVD